MQALSQRICSLEGIRPERIHSQSNLNLKVKNANMQKKETIDDKITLSSPLSTRSSQSFAPINTMLVGRADGVLKHNSRQAASGVKRHVLVKLHPRHTQGEEVVGGIPAVMRASTSMGARLVALALMLLTSFPLAAATGGAIYRFDEGSGITALDASGAGNNGSSSGASYVAGYAGSALRFRAGQMDRVVVPQSVFAGFGNTVFFEATIRPSAYPGMCGGSTARATIFRKRAHYNDFELDLLNDGRLDSILYSADGNGISVRTPSAIPLNSWTKVAVGYDGTKLVIMVNGQTVATQTGQLTLDWAKNYYTTQIGNNTTDGNCDYSFSGDIDEVTLSAFPIIQAPPCTYSLSTSSLTAPQVGSTGTLQVTASAPSCTWVASSASSWISLAPSTGTGSGALVYTIGANLLPNSPRTGSMLISGQPVSVGQGALSIPTQGALVYVKTGEAWIINTDGSRETQLTQLGGITQARLSNGILVFMRNNQLYRSPLAGFSLSASPVAIPNASGVLEFDVNPDGTRLTLTFGNNFTLYTMNTDGTSLATIYATASRHQSGMHWARNGFIYFVQSDFGNALSQQIFRIPETGASPPELLVNYFSQYPAVGGQIDRMAFLYGYPVKYARFLSTDPAGTFDVPNVDAGDGANIAYDYQQDVLYYPRFGSVYRVNIDGSNRLILAQAVFAGVDYGILPIIDSTPPLIQPTISGLTGTNGWFRGTVTVTWNVTDPDSPISSSTGCGPATVTADTPGTVITCSATSQGGTSTQSVTIKLDTTPPTGNVTKSPEANGNGWNNSNVNVLFVCSDSLSGVVVVSQTISITSEGAGQTAQQTCQDFAGNSIQVNSVVSIDKTPPLNIVASLPLPNASGWNNSNVTVSFACSDSLSGVVSPGQSVPVTTEGAGQPFNFTCQDLAGNSRSGSALLNIDKTAPLPSVAKTPLANAAGWNNTDVSILFNCGDAISGPVVTNQVVVVSTEGAGQIRNFLCQDRAGNSIAVTGLVNIDKTKPILNSLAATPNPVSINAPISLLANITDSGSSNLARFQYRIGSGSYSLLGSVSGPSATINGSIGLFATPAVINLCAFALDLAGNESPEECTMIAVYDPDGGFVTGAGTFQSPLGALTGSTTTGRAQFAFQAKYQRGADVPTGNTQFKFKAASFEFDSGEYQWLVVAGAKAQFKGTGVIKGRTGTFDFLLTAIDGSLPGGGGEDKFRLKITGPGGVVYDNNLGASDSADANTLIDGGNIVIHK